MNDPINFIDPPSQQLSIPSWDKLHTYSSIELLAILESFGIDTEPYKRLNSSVLACLIWCRTLIELPDARYDGVNVPYSCNSIEELLNWSRLGYRCQIDKLSFKVYEELLGTRARLRDQLNTGNLAIILGNLSYLPIRVSNAVYLTIRRLSLDNLYLAVELLLTGSVYYAYLPLYHFEDLVFILTTGYVLNKQDILDSDRYKQISDLPKEQQQVFIDLYPQIYGYKNPIFGVIQIAKPDIKENIILSSSSVDNKLEQLGLVNSPRSSISKEQYLYQNSGKTPGSPISSTISISDLEKMSDTARFHELYRMSDRQILNLFGVELAYSTRDELVQLIVKGFNQPMIYWFPQGSTYCTNPSLPIPQGYTGDYVVYGFWNKYYCFPTQSLLQHFASGSRQIPGTTGRTFTEDQVRYIQEYTINRSNTATTTNMANVVNVSNVINAANASSSYASSSYASSSNAGNANSSNAGNASSSYASSSNSSNIISSTDFTALLKKPNIERILKLLGEMGEITKVAGDEQMVTKLNNYLQEINYYRTLLSANELELFNSLPAKPELLYDKPHSLNILSISNKLPTNFQMGGVFYEATSRYYLQKLFS